jgi:signal transduction histidine kinase
MLVCLAAGVAFAEITDNGTGIPDGASEKPDSFGLLGMRERCAAVGGSMELRRNADSGTSVSVRIPLSACA